MKRKSWMILQSWEELILLFLPGYLFQFRIFTLAAMWLLYKPSSSCFSEELHAWAHSVSSLLEIQVHHFWSLWLCKTKKTGAGFMMNDNGRERKCLFKLGVYCYSCPKQMVLMLLFLELCGWISDCKLWLNGRIQDHHGIELSSSKFAYPARCGTFPMFKGIFRQ